MAQPIPFPFHNSLALRIANLITSDIEKLEQLAFGKVTGWQSRYERPYKAYYANDIAKRCDGNTEATRLIHDNLRELEANAQRYMSSNTRGRPLSQFRHDPDANTKYPKQNYTRKAGDSADKAGDYDDTSGDEADTSAASAGKDSGPPPMVIKRFGVDGKEVPPKPAAASGMDENRVREIATDVAREVVTTAAPQIIEMAGSEADRKIKAAPEGIRATEVVVKLPEREAVNVGIQHKRFPELLQIMTHFPVWLPGPAGSGKTTAAKHAAKALGVPFRHTGAVDNVYRLLGYEDANGRYHTTDFRRAYEHGGSIPVG